MWKKRIKWGTEGMGDDWVPAEGANRGQAELQYNLSGMLILRLWVGLGGTTGPRVDPNLVAPILFKFFFSLLSFVLTLEVFCGLLTVIPVWFLLRAVSLFLPGVFVVVCIIFAILGPAPLFAVIFNLCRKPSDRKSSEPWKLSRNANPGLQQRPSLFCLMGPVLYCVWKLAFVGIYPWV